MKPSHTCGRDDAQIDDSSHTNRGWIIKFTLVRAAYLFWLIPFGTKSLRRTLAVAVWPGGAKSICHALTGGSMPPGTASDTKVFYTAYDRGADGKQEKRIWRGPDFRTALSYAT